MRLTLTIALLMFAGLAVTGCGAVDDAKDTVVKKARGEAHRQCVKAATKIEDIEDRRDAIRACRSVKDGDEGGIRTEVARRCEKAAKEVSEPDLRRQARARCAEIRAGGK